MMNDPRPTPVFNATKEDLALIKRIIHRATVLGILRSPLDDRHCLMDLECTHCSGCPLDFNMLLNFSDEDFRHDLCNIKIHLNRVTGKLENFFDPRCAASSHRHKR